MKTWVKFFVVLAFTASLWVFASSGFAAADIRVTQQEASRSIDVAVLDPSGNIVKTLAMGTVREKVSAGGQDFIASFGQNPSGNAVLIAAPDPDNPKEVILRVNGRRIVISRDAVVTFIFPLDPVTKRLEDPLIRPGLVGTVTVDGRRLAPDTLVSLGSGQPVAIAQTTAPTDIPSDSTLLTPELDLSSFNPGGSTGFPGLGPNAPLPGGQGPPKTLSPIPSSISGFLGDIGINLNPAAATPTVPEQT